MGEGEIRLENGGIWLPTLRRRWPGVVAGLGRGYRPDGAAQFAPVAAGAKTPRGSNTSRQ